MNFYSFRVNVKHQFNVYFFHLQAEQERERQQQKEKDDDDDNSDSDDLGGPKVIILEQKRQTMEDICRIGTCYLGVIPPSSVVYFNDSYDSNGLDVSEHSTFIIDCSAKTTLNENIIFFSLGRTKSIDNVKFF